MSIRAFAQKCWILVFEEDTRRLSSNMELVSYGAGTSSSWCSCLYIWSLKEVASDADKVK